MVVKNTLKVLNLLRHVSAHVGSRKIIREPNSAPWWWFLREPKHVGTNFILL